MKTHLVIDLETLSTDPDAVVVSVGIVPVKYDTDHSRWVVQGQNFIYTILNASQQIRDGRKVDTPTLEWWKTTPCDKARSELFDSFLFTAPVRSTVYQLAKTITEEFGEDVVIWGKGPSFDNAILRSLFSTYGVKPFWKYNAEGCLRTAERLNPSRRTDSIIPHHARFDAEAEAHDLVKAHDALGHNGCLLY